MQHSRSRNNNNYFKKSSIITNTCLTFFASTILLPLSTYSAWGQKNNLCDVFTKIPVFTEDRLNSETFLKTNLHKLACSSDWGSHEDAMNTGIDVGTVVYGVPIQVGATFDRDQVDIWKKDNCSAEDRNADSSTIISKSYIKYDPVNSYNALKCIESLTNKDAITCSLDEYQDAVTFNIKWRRTYGEKENSAPIVEGFAAENVENCSMLELVAKGNIIPDGGRTVFCSRTKKAASFVINTNRGMCSKIGYAKSEPRVLGGKMVLSGPLTLAGVPIRLSEDLEIVTGPYSVYLQATTLQIDGQISIRSFDIDEATSSKFGASAGSVYIYADDVISNGAITIRQSGQNAGPGAPGMPGAPGSPGSNGVGRTQKQGQICENIVATVFDPLGIAKNITKHVCHIGVVGCEGGKNGGPGFAGGDGQAGGAGFTGGAAGEVTISVAPHQTEYFVVQTNVGADGQYRDCGGKICGGLGGPGGPGGAGGVGGAGGPGAPGVGICGGTDAGSRGPNGNPGPSGQPGIAGTSARFKT